ncbi:hypothetical protein BaRGS_00011670, partial [Batillaria attramentaria]
MNTCGHELGAALSLHKKKYSWTVNSSDSNSRPHSTRLKAAVVCPSHAMIFAGS